MPVDVHASQTGLAAMNFLRPKEEIRLLEAPKPLLDQLVIQTPLMTGLSPGELADLQVTDIMWDYGVIAVWRSKISRDHLSLVDSQTLFRLWQYVDKRKRGPLFQLGGTRRMKVQAMRRNVKRWARKANLPRWHRVTPYTLRHTFCVKWVMAHGDLESLRRQLGLKSLQKLKHYLDFDFSHVRREYARIFGDITELTRRHWTLHLNVPYVV